MGRKRQPYLSVVPDADNRTKDKPFNGRLGSRVVKNPFYNPADLLSKEWVTSSTSLRDDPLERLNARRQLRPHQYEAGSKLQGLFELAEPASARAMDFRREPVDGGGTTPEPISDAQMHAYDELQRVRGYLGERAYKLAREVLAERRFLEDIAESQLDFSCGREVTKSARKSSREFIGRSFRVALDDAAQMFGLQGTAPVRREIRDKHFRAARSVTRRVPQVETKEAA